MKALSSTLLLALLAAGAAHAACEYPKAPEKIPDGATATLAEMKAAQQQLQEYNAQVKAYTECLRQEYSKSTAGSDPSKMTDEQKAQQAKLEQIAVQKSNSAVDDAQRVTDRFNEQVRAFKARGDKGKG